MTSEKDDKLPPIDVQMGNFNRVDHIGHKITYEAPPPSPNAIRQDGRIVGVFEGQPVLQSGFYRFPSLVFTEPFDEGAAIEIQGVKLVITSCDAQGSVSMAGFGNRIIFQNAWCQTV